VSPASRRITIYWLLLLVPTLVVGGAALQLLRREQARIEMQGAYALEARRAAATARARLVVENVELLIGDAQAALLDTLGSEPETDLKEFLAQWQKNNPLVRTAFICTPDGQLLWPEANDATDDARGFIRRFGSLLKQSPPWTPDVQAKDHLNAQAKKQNRESDSPERKEIASNVAQVQSARRDVQELAKARDYSISSRPAAASTLAETDVALADRQSAGAPAASSIDSTIGSSVPRKSTGLLSGKTALSKMKSANVPAPVAAETRSRTAGGSERRGWVTLQPDKRLHLLGWVQPAGDSNVRGVELELAAIISRLAGALPADVGEGEGYALRDDQQRVVHQVGAVALTSAPAIRVPVSEALLPGWEVAAFLPAADLSSGNEVGILWFGTILIAIFVFAILAGGSLLLRQARRSELEAAQKTSFVANVSHEFKTPLTTIRLYAELLEQGRVRDEKQGEDYLRTIGRETQRLARLVNNALDFSRLEQGQKKYSLERLDLVSELKRMLETHAPRVTDAGLALRSSLPDGALFVSADRDAVEQIILNLVDNACKYDDTGGEVLVSAAALAGGGAEIRVADRGPGVPSDQRERIFEKFHRINDALTAEKTGAGLGLSIARQLAWGLSGDVHYENRAGGGSEFVLTLP